MILHAVDNDSNLEEQQDLRYLAFVIKHFTVYNSFA